LSSTSERAYSSARRSEQAAATRERIATAARRSFIERGFTATTIEQIARDAGVATPTVYSAYGSKRAIMMKLLEDVVAKDSLRASLSNEADIRKQLRLVVEFDVRLFTQGADLIGALRGASAQDEALNELRMEGEKRRRKSQSELIHVWAERGALRQGLSENEAADVLWAMTSDLVYNLFVRGNRWPIARYEQWLYSTLEALLLR